MNTLSQSYMYLVGKKDEAPFTTSDLKQARAQARVRRVKILRVVVEAQPRNESIRTLYEREAKSWTGALPMVHYWLNYRVDMQWVETGVDALRYRLQRLKS